VQQVTPKITIEGVEVDFIQCQYKLPGILSSASLDFTLPLEIAGTESLWNKEVTLYIDKGDSKPVFRGWINRTKKTLNDISIFAEDAIGYMIKGGAETTAEVKLDDQDNLDGLTPGAAIIKLINLAKLTDKVGTDFIGDTNPIVGSVQKTPIRGTKKVMDVIKTLLQKPIYLADQDLPRINIAKLIDDGSKSQLVIELEADLENTNISKVYTEEHNIVNLNIIERKIPNYIVVNGNNNVKGTFSHDGAITALDRNYLTVTNNNLDSPAECVEFGARLYQANISNRYEYGIQVTEGLYLSENEVIRIETDNPKFSGNYRVVGKSINFTDTITLGITINKKPPTLAEYISSRDN
jgi:hypothetical protein